VFKNILAKLKNAAVISEVKANKVRNNFIGRRKKGPLSINAQKRKKAISKVIQLLVIGLF
jgi:hypothetical protein